MSSTWVHFGTLVASGVVVTVAVPVPVAVVAVVVVFFLSL